MLRISENNPSFENVILLLEGQVVNSWVEIVRESCEQALAKNCQLILDCAGVTFADRQGIALFQILQRCQVKLINCSPFLKEQLKEMPGLQGGHYANDNSARKF